MKKYLTNIITKTHTPQSEPIPGTNQVKNSAGGFAWQVDQWDHLRRFLVLGSEGGSYYANERTLTVQNANNVLKCIEADGVRVVNEVVAISKAGRAPKNDPAIFVLALAASVGNDAARKAALDALPEVCRTGTHLFTFAQMVKGMRGWGRGLRRAVGRWYTAREPRELAYQLVKYRQRGGWTHMDTLRLAHPVPQNDAQKALFLWATKRSADAPPAELLDWTRALASPDSEALAFIWGFERMQEAQTADTVIKLIQTYDLPREALPTQWLNDAAVWAALLDKMPLTAMIRNLASMSRVGLLKSRSDAEKTVIQRLTDVDLLRKARVHPIQVLSALRVYALGYSLRGQINPNSYYHLPAAQPEWKPVARILDALDEAFELAFHNIEPAGKRFMLALDVSGSMSAGMIAGVPGLTPRDGSAAMAMVTARTEKDYEIVSFQDKIVPLNISARMRLDDVVKATDHLPFGATDCAQPMLYALKHKIPVDTFVVYTDSETWHGKIHPVQALRDYRETMSIPARLVVVGMVSNGFTIADPNDAGMLDVVGFDAASPGLIADFARGEL